MAIYSSNPNANRNFHIEEKFEAGVVLSGSEVKSIKNGKISIKESYAIIKKGELIPFAPFLSFGSLFVWFFGNDFIIQSIYGF